MQRNTVQRQIILNTLKKLKSHPCIDDIYAEIHKHHPSISKTTVYRNLRQLTQHGIIRQVSLPDGLERYDGTANPHYHFQCTLCEIIFDVDLEYLESINDIVQQNHGFHVANHDIVFKGICINCMKKSQKGKNEHGKLKGNKNGKKLDGGICRRKSGKK